MWTLLVLGSVIASCGAQGQTTEMSLPTSEAVSGPPCGGYLSGSQGTFYSPNYPNNYPHSVNCIWYIRPGNKIVELEFSSVQLEGCHDYIEVYDGYNTGYRILGKLCGATRATFHSTGYYLTVRFKTDGSVSYSGFRANYRVVASGSCRYNCGYQVGSCSCSSSCEWNGNCCRDYRNYCLTMTSMAPTTDVTHWYSCQYNCGLNLGICSCTSSCKYHGNCCYGYDYFCPTTTQPTTAQPSCRYNCGRWMGSCSCSSSCRYNGNCCHDYNYYCPSTTVASTTAQPSCRYNCGRWMGSCSCSSSCRYNGNCCHDYNYYCSSTTVASTTARPSCRYNCGRWMGSCSCSSSCRYNGNCCHDYNYYCPSTTVASTTAQPSCRYNCGRWMRSCSCSSSCRYNGNCCYDYNYYCSSTTVASTTARPSCRYNCGSWMGSCSCSSSCRYNGNCCHDYNYYCPSTTVASTTAQPSCRYNCGRWMGSCSCSSSCRYNGNCCHDYNYYCSSTTVASTTARPSCRYNCGSWMGSCSCSSSCRYNGNCCHDYNYYCPSTTVASTTAQPSCRYNCGRWMGSCSCSSSCRYNGNCCHDYNYYCSSTTVAPTTARPSCRYNCGRWMGSCSCSSSCRYNGNCCHDYNYYCPSTTVASTTAQPSCRYNCGRWMGSCSCSSSCRYNGNCCYDYNYYCSSTTVASTTARPSCRYNCGRWMGSCSCSSSCRYNGNCCHDYNYYCSSATVAPTTAQPSCRHNCGRNMGSCSCSSSCEYYGTCCYDYYYVCPSTTQSPPSTTGGPCGGSLFGSGTFSSPNHPNYYYDNAYCTWQLRAPYDQRLFLTFTYLQLENCCSCDYIKVYDGPSVGSRYLGTVCNNNTLNSFYSTSNYMTVLFRTDGSVVGRGFSADFISSLSPSSGRVDCSSDNMNIVIERSYLNSLGYDGHSLYLNDPQCRPQVSYYQVVFSFPINSCGTIRKFESGRIVYSNTIRAYTSNSGEITRQSHLKLNVACRMEQDSVAQIMYVVNHVDNSSITGTGRFNTSMDFYTSSSFYYKVTQVPYEVTLNQNLYIQVDLRRGDNTLDLFLDTCVASPSPHDFNTRAYYLVRNGCRMDSTYHAYVTGTSPYAQFTFRAFQFLRATESVYIQCKVLICSESDTNSRCKRGCSRRAVRGVGSKHDSQTLVLGPIKLKEPEKKEEETQKEDKA